MYVCMFLVPVIFNVTGTVPHVTMEKIGFNAFLQRDLTTYSMTINYGKLKAS